MNLILLSWPSSGKVSPNFLSSIFWVQLPLLTQVKSSFHLSHDHLHADNTAKFTCPKWNSAILPVPIAFLINLTWPLRVLDNFALANQHFLIYFLPLLYLPNPKELLCFLPTSCIPDLTLFVFSLSLQNDPISSSLHFWHFIGTRWTLKFLFSIVNISCVCVCVAMCLWSSEDNL